MSVSFPAAFSESTVGDASKRYGPIPSTDSVYGSDVVVDGDGDGEEVEGGVDEATVVGVGVLELNAVTFEPLSLAQPTAPRPTAAATATVKRKRARFILGSHRASRIKAFECPQEAPGAAIS
jgi:hypothetical protein